MAQPNRNVETHRKHSDKKKTTSQLESRIGPYEAPQPMHTAARIREINNAKDRAVPRMPRCTDGFSPFAQLQFPRTFESTVSGIHVSRLRSCFMSDMHHDPTNSSPTESVPTSIQPKQHGSRSIMYLNWIIGYINDSGLGTGSCSVAA